jgi:predicted Zn-dependent protease
MFSLVRWLLFLPALCVCSWGHGGGQNRLAQITLRLESRPELVGDRLERAVLLLGTGDFDRALYEVSIVRQLVPSHAGGLMLEATILEKAGQLEGAREVLVEYLHRFPQSVEGLERTAKLLLSLKRDAEALDCLDRLCRVVERPQPDLLVERVLVAERLHGPAAALAWLEQRPAAASLPGLRQHAVRLALACGRAEQALAELGKQAASQPQNLSLRLEIARILLQTGQSEAATTKLTEFELLFSQLSARQQDTPYHQNLAQTYRTLMNQPLLPKP